ncbi:TonB-dependent receptor plug domain-containing protein [Rhodanobacter ginsenosidimutans]|uniref:TonB-dependent receptor plug domain-containing protein n=1 Tax=Rhodanobacter ginsenosidimutans TaxID=490571 RepID=A0ABW0JWC1_9GAMM
MKFSLLPVLVSLMATQAIAATDEVIVTGTYSPVTAEQIASSVTVIDHQQLLALSNHSLADALRQVPGVWVAAQGGPGGLTTISLRGAEANHTLVLVDGIEMNDPTNTRGGAFDVNDINIASIQRVEIIRGAQSAIYGSDALAGVIHIITAEPTPTIQQHLSLSAGEHGYRTGSFSGTGTVDNTGYVLRLQDKHAGMPIEGSSANNREALIKLDSALGAHQLDFTYRHTKGEKTTFPEQSGGPLFARNRDLDRSHYTDQNAAASWAWAISDGWTSTLAATWFNRDQDIDSPGIIPFDAVPPNGARTDFTRTNIKWINTLGDKQGTWANIGFEGRHEAGESRGYLVYGERMPTDFRLSRSTRSAFLNLNSYLTGKLFVGASLRSDSNAHFGTRQSVQGGFRYQLSDNVSWFANAGTGYKLPSFFALGHPLTGNKDLQPERSATRDTGIEWTASNTVLNLSYFVNDYKDLIDFDSELFRNVNRAHTRMKGVDIDARWHSNDRKWTLGAHGSYTDIDAESPLLGRPRIKAGATAAYAPNDHWQFDLNYLWTGHRFEASRYSGDVVNETMPEYDRLNARVNYRINPQLAINLSVENVTDRKYMDDIGFPAIGTTGFVGIDFDF